MEHDARWPAGKKFEWQFADGTASGSATVFATWSDTDIGLAPESEQYASLWMKAHEAALAADKTSDAEKPLTFLLGTDERVYLDGKEVFLKAI